MHIPARYMHKMVQENASMDIIRARPDGREVYLAYGRAILFM